MTRSVRAALSEREPPSTFGISLILSWQRLAVGELDGGEVLTQAQAQEHLNDELACAVRQHIVPAPLHSHAQVLQLAYTGLGHAASLVLHHTHAHTLQPWVAQLLELLH